MGDEARRRKSPPPGPLPDAQGGGERFPSPRSGEGLGEGRKPSLHYDESEGLGEGRKHPHTRTTTDIWDKLKPFAREMRSRPTPAEDALWQRLRRKQLHGYKFRRQHPIDKFIVDFFCADAWLAIEVDGSIHEQQQEYDHLRQAFIESRGIRVLRFSNEDVLRNIHGVLNAISNALNLPPTHWGE